MMSYSDWCDYNAQRIIDECEDWIDNAPYGLGSFLHIEDHIQDVLEDAYEDYVSELQDRAYDEYRDSLLDLED